MLKICCLLATIFLLSCKTTTYFVVRHAEKESNTMSSDVPLSAAGKQRAEALKDLLRNENIRFIYSTNYIRTKSTAQPLAESKGMDIQVYDPADTAFVGRIRKSNAGNLLIVGHSNTVDDLVNKLVGETKLSDLPDAQYGDLFVVKRKGKKYSFEKKHFGN